MSIQSSKTNGFACLRKAITNLTLSPDDLKMIKKMSPKLHGFGVNYQQKCIYHTLFKEYSLFIHKSNNFRTCLSLFNHREDQ